MIAFMKRYVGFFLLAFGVVGLLLSNLIDIDAETRKDSSSSEELITTESTGLSKRVFVDIKGEIYYPGIYQLSADSRIGDLIKLAGGCTEQADLSAVNLATPVYDEMMVIIPEKATSEIINANNQVYVDIKGEVVYPGLYCLPASFRVYDAIMRAGGFTDYADTSGVNLSLAITDQMLILIPSIIESTETTIVHSEQVTIEITGEVVYPGLYSVNADYLIKDVINKAGGVTSEADLSEIDLNQGIVRNMSINIPKLTHGSTEPETDSSDYQTSKININTAMVDELDSLPGIGYILAQRIIDYRAEFGPFECIEDIMLVNGIKNSVYEQIKDLICI